MLVLSNCISGALDSLHAEVGTLGFLEQSQGLFGRDELGAGPLEKPLSANSLCRDSVKLHFHCAGREKPPGVER